MVLDVALEHTDLSSRQLAAWITDNKGFSVSESSVYRLLMCQELVKSPEMKMAAGKDFHAKTTCPHQMWATDASYFRVCGWGFYYLVTVMDNFSRFIIAWRLQTDMASDSFIEVVQDAVDLTGMTDVPWEHRTRLLSDNGPGYISHSFGEYLRLVSIRHILPSPFHPQTNGNLERYHRAIKLDVNQIQYDVPGNLEGAITDFVNYYNNRRYHKALGNSTEGRQRLRCDHRRTPLWSLQDMPSQSAHRYEAGQWLDSGPYALPHRSLPALRQSLPERVPEDGTTAHISLVVSRLCRT